MRRKVRYSRPGDRRTKQRFLLFPKLVESEWRWLEVATWEDEYCGSWWTASHWL